MLKQVRCEVFQMFKRSKNGGKKTAETKNLDMKNEESKKEQADIVPVMLFLKLL